MASSNTNKTILAVAIGAVLVFLAIKLWPALRSKLNGGSGGSGATGSTSAWEPYSPYGYGQQGNNSGLNAGGSFGPGTGSGGRFSAAQQTLGQFLSGIDNFNENSMPFFNQLLNNDEAQIDSASPSTVGPFTQGPFSDLLSLWDQATGQYDLQNLNDLPSWSPDDPNAPWNSSGGSGLSVVSDENYLQVGGPDGSDDGDGSPGDWGGDGGLQGGGGS